MVWVLFFLANMCLSWFSAVFRLFPHVLHLNQNRVYLPSTSTRTRNLTPDFYMWRVSLDVFSFLILCSWRSWCMCIWWGMQRNSRTWPCSPSAPSSGLSRYRRIHYHSQPLYKMYILFFFKFGVCYPLHVFHNSKPFGAVIRPCSYDRTPTSSSGRAPYGFYPASEFPLSFP